MSDGSWLKNLEALHPNPKPSGPQHVNGDSGPNLSPTIEDPRTRGAVRGAIEGSWDNVVNARSRGEGRNHMLNTEAFNLGQLVGNGLITEQQVIDHLMAAAAASGVLAEDGHEQCLKTIMSGLKNGIPKPRTNLPVMEAPKVSDGEVKGWDDDNSIFDEPAVKKKPKGEGPGARVLKMRKFSALEDRQPTWAWHYNGAGRIQTNTLCIFSGPPGTGKSTAARWFAAQATRGELDGCWYGTPINVAYIAVEEDLDAMVKPSLRAAGADVDRVFYPEVVMDEQERIFMSTADEKAMTEALLENEIKLLIIDPIMSTLGGGVDIHRNNEVRDAIQPFLNMAQAMDGLSLGIAHYKKGGATNGVAAITGSSAFGEVTRSVFGFMKGGMDANEPRVMSQSKNSAGREDLALEYALELVDVPFPDGSTSEMTRFKILGDSNVTVEDLMSESGTETRTKVDEAMAWLEDFLMQSGQVASQVVKREGKAAGDFSESVLKRACKRLGVISTNISLNGRPRVTVWDLPHDENLSAADRAAGPDHDF